MRIKQKTKLRPSQPLPRSWKPLIKIHIPDDAIGGEYFENDRYQVRRVEAQFEGVRCIRLGIANRDQSARRDWRDFQEIKNQLAGPNWEGFELYPAESRKQDPSNYFYLWCFEHGLPFGIFKPRCVLGPHQAIAPQRRFA